MATNGRRGGAKTGGRKKGTPNKRTVKTRETLEKFIDSIGNLPLEEIADIGKQAKAKGDYTLALAAYKELAQYCAPKRKAIEHSQDQNNPLQPATRIELIAKK